MKSNRGIVSLAIIIAGLVLYYGISKYNQARHNLVTLDVRDMDVRKVVKKIEWQTWETILVHSNIQGKITLRVEDTPMEKVLEIIAEQTSSSWSKLFPLYSSGKSLVALKRSLRGEIDPESNGWTNLQGRAMFRGGPGGMFGGGPGFNASQPTNDLVSLQFNNKDVNFAVLAMSRFAQLRIVPEDGMSGSINLTMEKMAADKAVSMLASKLKCDWTTLYSLRGMFGPGRNGGFGGPPGGFAMGGDTNAPGRSGPRQGMNPPGSTNDASGTNFLAQRGPGGMFGMSAEQREEMRKQREAQENELKQALPPAERQQYELAQQQREQQMQDMQNMTPEQRREQFMRMGGGGGAMDKRNLERLKNTTPEQRAEQSRRMATMRQRFQQQQGQSPRN